jgi:hypothetical protein
MWWWLGSSFRRQLRSFRTWKSRTGRALGNRVGRVRIPIALVIAWAFELTPEGIKRGEEVEPNESITRKTGRKLVAQEIVGGK